MAGDRVDLVSPSCFSCAKSPSPLLDETPGEAVDDNCVPFGDVFRQIRRGRRRPLPAFALFSGLRLNIISVTKRYILGGHVLTSFSGRGDS